MQALAALPSSAQLHHPPALDSLRAAPAMTTRRRRPQLKLNRSCPFSLHTVHCQRHPDHGVSGGDTDDMFDDLFKKYGKVVYRSTDQKRPTAEADDDAESLSFAVTLAKVANDVKAADIRVLFVKPLVYWTRFFIIVTAFSRPQIDAIGSRIRDTAEKQFNKIASGDMKPNSWTLLDFGEQHQKHSGRFSVWMIDEWATTRDTLDSLTSISSLLKWEVRDGPFNNLYDASRDVLKACYGVVMKEDAMVDNVRCYVERHVKEKVDRCAPLD